MTRTISISEIQNSAQAIIDLTRNGDEIVIEENGEPLVKVTPIETIEKPENLPPRAFAKISNSANRVFLSVASFWELQIKIQINKFKFTDPLKIVVNEQIKTNGFQIPPVTFAHVLELGKLPFHHRDPFDRLLIAQANAEKMILISSDSKFSAYPVNVLW